MQKGLYYISGSQHFLEKIKTNGSIPENAILVTADVVGLYLNIPQSSKFLRKPLKREILKRYLQKISRKWQNLY